MNFCYICFHFIHEHDKMIHYKSENVICVILGRIQGILLSRKCALSEQYPCSFSDYDVLEA